jgi:hypothetical protein
LIPENAEKLKPLLDCFIEDYLAIDETEDSLNDHGYKKKLNQVGGYQDSRLPKDKKANKIPTRKPLGN